MNATFLSEGTSPAGSVWKLNPVPECCPGASDSRAGACEQRGLTCGSYEHNDLGRKCGAHTCGADSGLGVSTPAFPWPTDDPAAPPAIVAPKFAIVDQLRLPSDMQPGHWVLGWRWVSRCACAIEVAGAATMWCCETLGVVCRRD